MVQVLDAPQLTDDFYLNLVDWSSQNTLAVGLGACVYLWSACNSKVTKLCEFSGEPQNTVCSVSWSQRGTYLSVGTNSGEVQIWDAIKSKLCVPLPSPMCISPKPSELKPASIMLKPLSQDRFSILRPTCSDTYHGSAQCTRVEQHPSRQSAMRVFCLSPVTSNETYEEEYCGFTWASLQSARFGRAQGARWHHGVEQPCAEHRLAGSQHPAAGHPRP